jgi:hypothetical protein
MHNNHGIESPITQLIGGLGAVAFMVGFCPLERPARRRFEISRQYQENPRRPEQTFYFPRYSIAEK